MKSSIIALFLAVMVPFSPARAADDEDSSFLYFDLHGSFIATPPTDTYANVEETDTGGLGGGLTVGYRFGDFALETGVHSYKQVWITEVPAAAGSPARVNQLLSYQYIGVPAALKWNYVESKLSVFYVKVGAALEFAQRRTDEDLIPSQFVSVLGGIGGSTELRENIGFLLDLQALQHFGFDSKVFADGVISAGFVFSL